MEVCHKHSFFFSNYTAITLLYTQRNELQCLYKYPDQHRSNCFAFAILFQCNFLTRNQWITLQKQFDIFKLKRGGKPLFRTKVFWFLEMAISLKKEK